LRRLLALIGLLGALIVPTTAHAAFPGANGKIAFTNGVDIWTVNPDGTGLANLTNSPGVSEIAPAWSPEGTRIAFLRATQSSRQIWTMNADGTGQSPVGGATPDLGDLTWSPDGAQIAYLLDDFHCEGGGLFRVNPDGTGNQQVTGTCNSGDSPTWSPDGKRIAFADEVFAGVPKLTLVDVTGDNRTVLNSAVYANQPNWSPTGQMIATDGDSDFNQGIHVLRPDGTGETTISNVGAEPAWAPDGTKIAFIRFGSPHQIVIVNADGSNPTPVPMNVGALSPDWQPIPINSYPRPKGATPLRVALVTANNACTSPNRTHGAPLAFGSCSPAQLSSNQLTVGTGDSNARPALMQASLRLDVAGGDVTVQASLNDVFNKDLSDYTGALRASLPVQITDKNNTPSPGGPGAATTATTPFDFTIGCTPTADTSAGSDCAVNTTLDTLVPGAVTAGKRAVWQLGQVKVYDGSGSLFAVQGVFIP
jgi:Tol biopolymer transport system component